MTIRHLKIFICVCECGGITKAAEAVHMAQPAVSTTMSELEKYYNVLLLTDQSKTCADAYGKRIACSKAKNVLAGFDDFETAANSGGTKSVYSYRLIYYARENGLAEIYVPDKREITESKTFFFY